MVGNDCCVKLAALKRLTAALPTFICFKSSMLTLGTSAGSGTKLSLIRLKHNVQSVNREYVSNTGGGVYLS